MIGNHKPYNAGEIRKTDNGLVVMICGHIWWPVEKTNAYHCMVMQDGEPQGDPKYIWDHTHGKWPIAA